MKSKIVTYLPASLFFLFCILHSSAAQELNLSASNQLEYLLDNTNQKDILHDWFDFILAYDVYEVGVRYEAHQPDDWGKTYQDFSYRYFQLSKESFKLTVGNYYSIFGRGLILRSYENRDLRFDNNLDGIKGTLDLDPLALTFLGGTPRGKYERVNDPLYGADGKITFFDQMTLGGSYLRTKIANPGFTQLYAENLSLVFPHLDLYVEHAEKDNPSGEYLEKDGEGFYLASNLYSTGFGLNLEYKDYRRFDFSKGEVIYNNPPSLIIEHLYTLLNRHSYILNLEDEKGIQARAIATPSDKLFLLTNYSYTTNHQNKLIFSELYGEIEYDYKDKATLKGGLSRTENKKEDGSPYFLGPVLDFTYYLSERNSFAFLIEHLWTNKYDGKITYYDQIISLSFSRSPAISLSLTHERTTEWKTRDWSGKRSWFIFGLDFALGEKHNFSLNLGSRRAGKICSGGICTDRPALDGMEVKLLSRF